MVLAFSSVTGAARNTMVVPIRDPFYPDYQQRVSVFLVLLQAGGTAISMHRN